MRGDGMRLFWGKIINIYNKLKGFASEGKGRRLVPSIIFSQSLTRLISAGRDKISHNWAFLMLIYQQGEANHGDKMIRSKTVRIINLN